MQTLSLLVFTKNDTQNAAELIDSLYAVVDDVVIVDSSNDASYRYIMDLKKRKKLAKVRIFRGPPLGHPNPYRMFALDKCRGGWVFQIDADERVSPLLTSHLRDIISNAHCSGFLINRIDSNPDGTVFSNHTYHLRLYRKSDVEFRGYPHETPNTSGNVFRMPNKYFFTHRRENGGKKTEKYLTIESYESRISYKNAATGNFWHMRGRGALAKAAYSPVAAYFKLKLFLGSARPEKELSKNEYSLINRYAYALGIARALIGLDAPRAKALFDGYLYQKKKIQYFFAMPKEERELAYAISYDIDRAGGVIKYLGIRDDSSVERLRRAYRSKLAGVLTGADTLIFLLKDRYRALHKTTEGGTRA